ncbi:hypothetical protein BGE01nite_33420 [Brevifollis gellanilyticus]|uniref:Uncharacterized protein n=1 Tax=Brevifollis gellanilyticus TaxID=748831 RepID=A0A512MCH2_9BACT|nr:hypothetical protein BGE01nite_33420 [Brevifollis gellanilyticus]
MPSIAKKIWEAERLTEAVCRDHELTSGKVQALSSDEFWQRVEFSKRAHLSARTVSSAPDYDR